MFVGGGIGKIVAGGEAAAFFGAEGWVGEDEVGFGEVGSVGAEGVSEGDVGVEVVEHEVHEGEALDVGDEFHAVDGAVALEVLLVFFEFEEVVGFFADVAVGGNEEAAGAGGGVLDEFAGLGIHEVDDGVDEGSWGEVLAGAGFGFVGVLLEQAFVEVAEAFAAGAVPVEAVDAVGEGFEVFGGAQGAVGVGKDGAHAGGLGVGAEVEEHGAVEVELFDAVFGGEVGPAVVGRQLVFFFGLLGHFEEEQVGELGDVFVVGDAVVAQDVTEVPEFGDDVLGWGDE